MYKGLTARVTLAPSCFGKSLLHPSCNRPAVLQPFPATVQTLPPFRYTLLLYNFLHFYILTLTSSLVRTPSRGVQIIPNLSTDPWTNWGLFLWQLPEAQEAMHEEWRSGKVGNVTTTVDADGTQGSAHSLSPPFPSFSPLLLSLLLHLAVVFFFVFFVFVVFESVAWILCRSHSKQGQNRVRPRI